MSETTDTRREGESYLEFLERQSDPIVHGRTCQKKAHNNSDGGYLHGEGDDAPYDVDGCKYCGRCHQAI